VVLDSADDELLLNAFEPATISEVGTKLDLARAYIDMGDPDGARSILLEVLQEGSVTQKQEAQRLVEALPG
jgi:pilus assembly protein FimV